MRASLYPPVLAVLALACTQPRSVPAPDAATDSAPKGPGETAAPVCADDCPAEPPITPTDIEVAGPVDARDADSGEPEYPTACPGGVIRHWLLPGEPTALDFSPDGTSVASGTEHGLVSIHRVSDGSKVADHSRHSAAIQAVRFAPGGLELAAGSDDGLLTYWKIAPATPPRVWVHGSHVLSVAFAPDNLTMVAGTASGVYLLKTAPSTLNPTGITQSAAFDHAGNRSVAYLPGATEVVVAQGERASRVAVLKATDLTLVRVIAGAQHLDPIGRLAVPAKNTVPPGGLLAYGLGPQLRVIHLGTAATVAYDQHGKPIEDVRILDDASRIVTSGADGTKVWTPGWTVLRSFEGPSRSAALSPDGKRLARRDGRRVLVHCLE